VFALIAKQLTELRRKHRYTLEEVGKQIGVSKQTLYKYEKGIITNIPSDRIEALAAFYGVTPSYIMGWGDTEANKKSLSTEANRQVSEILQNNKALENVFNILVHLDDEQLAMIRSITEAFLAEQERQANNE